MNSKIKKCPHCGSERGMMWIYDIHYTNAVQHVCRCISCNKFCWIVERKSHKDENIRQTL